MIQNQEIYSENRKINKQEIENKSIFLESKPRRLMLVLTSKCNLSCIMCDRKGNNYSLSEESIKGIIRFFPYLDSIMWQGGEVFIVDYFKEFFQEAMRYPQLVQEINTNGLLIDNEWVNLLQKANTRLIFSIDSTEKEVYEHIRKGAKFENLMNNINLLNEIKQDAKDLKITKTINIVIMRSNYKLLDKFIDFALKYKFSGLNFLKISGNACPQENIFQPIDAEALNYLRKEFPGVIEKCRGLNITISHELSSIICEREDALREAPQMDKENKLFCLMPWVSLFIDGSQNGMVYPECLCRRPIGNIFKHTLEEIWNNNNVQNYRKRIVNGNLENWCNNHCVNGSANKDFLQNW